jgi:5-methylcytosine-specific restriction enzyme B
MSTASDDFETRSIEWVKPVDTDHDRGSSGPPTVHPSKYRGIDRADLLPGAHKQPDLDFADALAAFNRSIISQQVQAAERERVEVVRRFPLEEWPQLPLERYALGTPDSIDSFCRWMEFRTPNLASIKGGSALKHLIFRRADGTWYFEKKYSSVDEAWTEVRAGFVEAFRLAAAGRFDDIAQVAGIKNAIALSTKAVFCYFPDGLLPVCSGAHQDHFWKVLGGEGSLTHGVPGAHALFELVRSKADVRDWSTVELMWFLYSWADPRQGERIVKIAPGPNADLWHDCLKNGYIRVGWDEVGDLAQFESRAQFSARFADQYSNLYNGNTAKINEKAGEVWTLTELVPGDIVIANRGTSEVVGIGRVNDRRYEWREDLGQFAHTVGVDWEPGSGRPIDPIKRWAFKTVAPVSQPEYSRILKGPTTATTTTAKPPVAPSSTVDPVLREIASELDRKGQVILYGPPGTGKTYNARRFAVWWLATRLKEPDSAHLLTDPGAFRDAEERLTRGASGRRVWWVTANATEWSWDQLFVDGSVDYRVGRLKRNYGLLSKGDLVLGYQATPAKRILALGRITETVHSTATGEKITIEPVQPIANGPTWDEIAGDERLAGSEPVRNLSRGTLFALTAAEASYLLSWLKERDPKLPDLDGGDADGGVGHLTRVTFHPSYTYEDFVEGFKPQSTRSGALDLALEDGIFKRVCAEARLKPGEPFLLLIDEINRGNIPKIFGELITLLELDKRSLSVTLPQSHERFDVPKNVFLLGTMNTADRSIRLLDAALRRRFAFVELMPDVGILAGATVGDLDLGLFLETLNERIAKVEGREKQIGHSFLLDGNGAPISDPEQFAAQFRHEIVPLLQEYAYEDYRELESYLGKQVVDVDAQAIRPGVLDDAQALVDALTSSFKLAVVEPTEEPA